MGITVVAVAVGLTLGYVRGGRIANVGDHSVRWIAVLAVGLVLQALLFGTQHGPWVLLVVSYACLLAFAGVNRRIPGMGVVAFGVLANLLVVTVNAGMPVRPDALVRAGIVDRADIPNLEVTGKRHIEKSDDKLTFLADIIPLPLPVQPYVVSFGDLILYVGLADVVFHLMRPRRRPRWLEAFDEHDKPAAEDDVEPVPVPPPSPDRRTLATTAVTRTAGKPPSPLVPVMAPPDRARQHAVEVLEAPMPAFAPPAAPAEGSGEGHKKVRRRIGPHRPRHAHRAERDAHDVHDEHDDHDEHEDDTPPPPTPSARPPKTGLFDQDLWDTGRHPAIRL